MLRRHRDIGWTGLKRRRRRASSTSRAFIGFVGSNLSLYGGALGVMSSSDEREDETLTRGA